MEETPDERKKCCLYIEADEDHIHRQTEGKSRAVLRVAGVSV